MTSETGIVESDITIRPTHARIDTGALRNNLRCIRSQLSGNVQVMGVVKANAYGHGVDICARVFAEEGVTLFGVASVEEGKQLRVLGIGPRIAVLSSPVERQYIAFAEYDLEAFVSDIRTAVHLSAVAEASGRKLRVHCYVDTGMTRNGCAAQEVPELLKKIVSLPGLHLQGIASHYATSDEPLNPFTAQQTELFESVLRSALDAGYRFEDIHIANSGGVFNVPQSHHTLVRPGLALYGYHPTEELHRQSGLIPVMSVRTVITSLRSIPTGVSVSYGRRYYTSQQTTIATLPIGYGDGIARGLTNRMDVLIAGIRYPVVGTICMDEVMVDLQTLDHRFSAGEEVIVIGESGEQRIDGWEMSRTLGTIPYEITCRITSRVPRVAA